MILIFSEANDSTTSLVCKWLSYYNSVFVRVNIDDSYSVNITESNVIIFNDVVEIDLDNVTSYWYRRGGLMLNSYKKNYKDSYIYQNIADVRSHIDNEHKLTAEYIYYVLSSKKITSIGNFFAGNLNRLITSLKAKKCGLNIPQFTISTTSNIDLPYEKNITKSISEVLSGRHQEFMFRILAQYVNLQDVKPSTLTYILEYIDKEFEIRIFFLKGNFYSMVIYSQLDPQTKVDFRNYNKNKPNRTFPFKLPKDIEVKLSKLMSELNLDTGSIDLLYKNGKFYFLEINPVGQFGMVSVPCNYQIERKIAEYLINE